MSISELTCISGDPCSAVSATLADSTPRRVLAEGIAEEWPTARWLAELQRFSADSACLGIVENGLSGQIAEIAKEWKCNHRDNKKIFVLRKVRSIVRRNRARNRNAPQKVFEPALWKNIEREERSCLTEVPDSIAKYSAFARKCPGFLGHSDTVAIPGLQNSAPLFSINGASLDRFSTIQLQTGHCLVPYQAEPPEEPNSRQNLVSLLVEDVLLFARVRGISKQLVAAGKRVSNVVILDTAYYASKVYRRWGARLPLSQCLNYVTNVAELQSSQIRAILPSCDIVQTHTAKWNGQQDEERRNLEAFIDRKFPNESNDKRTSNAALASTYTTYSLRPDAMRLSVESARNVEIVANIVIPYLEEGGAATSFGFVGLLPLPDLKMAYSAMYFGSKEGAIQITDRQETTWRRVQNMARTPLRAHACFATRYWLCRGETTRITECREDLCLSHQQALLGDMLELLEDLGIRSDLPSDGNALPSHR